MARLLRRRCDVLVTLALLVSTALAPGGQAQAGAPAPGAGATPPGVVPLPFAGPTPAPRAPAPPGTLPAPEAPARSMTLDEALAYAREHQPSLLAARARLAGSEAEARVPGALYYPRVAGTAQAFEGTANNSTASYITEPILDLPRIGATRVGTTAWNPYPSTLVAVGLRQEIFDFGRIAALQAVANAATEAERGRTDVVRLDVGFAVENAFFAVQAAKAVRNAAEAAYQRALVNRDAAAAGVRAGLREPIDLTRAEADLGRFDVARIRAEAGVIAAQSTFAAVVGVPEQALDAAGEPPLTAPAPTLREAMSEALSKDPLLRARRALLSEQQASTRLIASELRPNLFLTSTLSGRAGDALPTNGELTSGGGWVPNIPNWDVGLIVSWPLLDFGVRAREDASRALESARAAEIDELVETLGAAVQGAYVDLVAATRALPELERSLDAARANYAQADARFKAGLGTALELADAQAVLADAEIQLAVGRYQVSRARAQLGRIIAEGLS